MATIQEQERQALSDILKSPEQGGSAATGGILGAGADVPTVLDENPATRQLVEEQIKTRTGQPIDRAPIVSEPDTTQTRPVQESGLVYDQATGEYRSLRPGETAPGSGSTGGDLRSTIEERYAGLLNAPESKEQIQQREFDAIQGQIDALNRIYDQKVREENRLGEGRVGRGTALNSVAGTSFSPFGTSRIDEIERKNQGVVDAINAERANAIGALFSEARANALKESQNQTEQLRLATDSFISSISQAYNLDANERESLRNEALRRAALTGELDGKSTLDAQRAELDLKKYLTDTALAYDEADRANQRLEIDIQRAQREGMIVTTQPDGTVTAINVDLIGTGENPVTVLGNYAKPRVGGGAGSGIGLGDRQFEDTLVRDALNAYERAGGNPTNLDESDLANITSIYESRVGNQTPADQSEIFTRQREFYDSEIYGDVLDDSFSDVEGEVVN